MHFFSMKTMNGDPRTKGIYVMHKVKYEAHGDQYNRKLTVKSCALHSSLPISLELNENRAYNLLQRISSLHERSNIN